MRRERYEEIDLELESDEVQMIDLDAYEDVPDESRFGIVELRPTRDEINERLDKFVANHLTHLSRSYIQELIAQGNVEVDKIVRRRVFKMTPGQVVTVNVPEPVVQVVEAEDIPLTIVYEDDDLLVIDKVAGMVVHPAPGHPDGTLVNAVLWHVPEIALAGSNRPGIVHRLDKDTSGLIVVAKSDRGRTTLIRQWNARAVSKHYIALVHGVVADDSAEINVPIGRDPVQRNRMAAVKGGREAITRFTVLERLAGATLLDVEIETGRTHQIRVHLAFIDHPVVGDTVYNRNGGATGGAKSLAPRQFLHAARLGFTLPGGQEKIFESPLPEELGEPLARLREIPLE